MGITMLISLYTSRVVLETLGFVDYGIYAVVGGVVGIISFMQGSLGGATTRFLNIEMGKENAHNMRIVFSSAFYIHLALSGLILLLGETIGLWYILNKLNIPADRLDAAVIVYHLSIVATILTIMEIPYSATIIAHQKMNVFAYVSIAEALLKLGIAYLIVVSGYDKLISYAALVLLASLLVRIFYQVYCRVKFDECRLIWSFDKEYTKSIATFFGWDLYGNFSVAVKNQGVQLIQNHFFGTIVNAAVGIASTVTGIISGLAGNLSLAVKPQIFQEYAKGNRKEVMRLTYLSSKMSFILVSIFAIPFLIDADLFLGLWLKNVPEYTNIFCKLILIQVCISACFRPLNDPIHATGNIKMLSFLGGSIILSSIFISYLLLLVKTSPLVIYLVNIAIAFIGGLVNMKILKNEINDFNYKFFLMLFGKNAFFVIIAVLIGLQLKEMLNINVLIRLLIVSICVLLYGLLVFVFVLDADRRRKILDRFDNIKRKFWKQY